MVEFGKYLQRNCISEWKAHYVRYEELKKCLKRLAAARAARIAAEADMRNASGEDVSDAQTDVQIEIINRTEPPASAAETAEEVGTLVDGAEGGGGGVFKSPPPIAIQEKPFDSLLTCLAPESEVNVAAAVAAAAAAESSPDELSPRARNTVSAQANFARLAHAEHELEVEFLRMMDEDARTVDGWFRKQKRYLREQFVILETQSRELKAADAAEDKRLRDQLLREQHGLRAQQGGAAAAAAAAAVGGSGHLRATPSPADPVIDIAASSHGADSDGGGIGTGEHGLAGADAGGSGAEGSEHEDLGATALPPIGFVLEDPEASTSPPLPLGLESLPHASNGMLDESTGLLDARSIPVATDSLIADVPSAVPTAAAVQARARNRRAHKQQLSGLDPLTLTGGRQRSIPAVMEEDEEEESSPALLGTGSGGGGTDRVGSSVLPSRRLSSEAKADSALDDDDAAALDEGATEGRSVSNGDGAIRSPHLFRRASGLSLQRAHTMLMQAEEGDVAMARGRGDIVGVSSDHEHDGGDEKVDEEAEEEFADEASPSPSPPPQLLLTAPSFHRRRSSKSASHPDLLRLHATADETDEHTHHLSSRFTSRSPATRSPQRSGSPILSRPHARSRTQSRAQEDFQYPDGLLSSSLTAEEELNREVRRQEELEAAELDAMDAELRAAQQKKDEEAHQELRKMRAAVQAGQKPSLAACVAAEVIGAIDGASVGPDGTPALPASLALASAGEQMEPSAPVVSFSSLATPRRLPSPNTEQAVATITVRANDGTATASSSSSASSAAMVSSSSTAAHSPPDFSSFSHTVSFSSTTSSSSSSSSSFLPPPLARSGNAFTSAAQLLLSRAQHGIKDGLNAAQHGLKDGLNAAQHGLKDAQLRLEDGLIAAADTSLHGVEALQVHARLRMRLMLSRKPWETLRIAYKELFRGIQLLKDYKMHNYTAFTKILKKHRKTMGRDEYGSASQAHSPNQLLHAKCMSMLNSLHVFASPELHHLQLTVETVFARDFNFGNRKAALTDLKPVSHQMSHLVTFRLGLLLGLSLCLFIVLIFLWHFVSLRSGTSETVRFKPVLPVYRGLFLVILHLWCWGANVHMFRKTRINYQFIFEIDTRTELKSAQILQAACLLTFLWFLSLDLYLATELLKDYWPDLIPGYFHLVLYVILFLGVFCPFNILARPTRLYIATTLRHIITTGWGPVAFRDFYTCNQLCSLANVLNDLSYGLCFYVSGDFRFESESFCKDFSSETQWVLAMLPYWFRFCQCLKRYKDSGAKRQLANAGKYALSLNTTFWSSMNKHYPGAFVIPWVMCAVVSTCASYSWDVKSDWSLMEWRWLPWNEKHSFKARCHAFFLRKRRVLNNATPYYIAIVTDCLLRLSWVSTISAPEQFAHATGIPSDYFKSIVYCLEILRRNQWNFYRLENEHWANVDKEKVINIVALKLPKKTNREEQERAIDLAIAAAGLNSDVQRPRRINAVARAVDRTFHTICPRFIVTAGEVVVRWIGRQMRACATFGRELRARFGSPNANERFARATAGQGGAPPPMAYAMPVVGHGAAPPIAFAVDASTTAPSNATA